MPSVLIVDDQGVFRSAARRVLERSGFDVVGDAEDGRQALARIAALRPDVVLLDVQLPDIDGFEVARRLQTAGSHAAVVLVSSRAARDYGDAVSQAPVRGFVPKHELTGPRVLELLEPEAV